MYLHNPEIQSDQEDYEQMHFCGAGASSFVHLLILLDLINKEAFSIHGGQIFRGVAGETFPMRTSGLSGGCLPALMIPMCQNNEQFQEMADYVLGNVLNQGWEQFIRLLHLPHPLLLFGNTYPISTLVLDLLQTHEIIAPDNNLPHFLYADERNTVHSITPNKDDPHYTARLIAALVASRQFFLRSPGGGHRTNADPARTMRKKGGGFYLGQEAIQVFKGVKNLVVIDPIGTLNVTLGHLLKEKEYELTYLNWLAQVLSSHMHAGATLANEVYSRAYSREDMKNFIWTTFTRIFDMKSVHEEITAGQVSVVHRNAGTPTETLQIDLSNHVKNTPLATNVG